VKRFLLASVMALTVTAMPTTALADETPAPATITPPAATAAAPAPAPAPAPTVAAPVATAYRPTPPATPVVPVVTAPKPPVVTAAPPPAVVAAPPPAVVVAPAAAAAPPPAVAPPTAVPAPDASATLLAARPAAPAKPLALAPASEGLGLGYKILAIVAIGGAVALYLRKKRGPKVAGIVPSKIDILSRSSIGVRSQLVVVEVEGTRLLVGMTPNAIQTLAVLQTPEDDNVAAEARASEVEDRLERDREMIRPANLGDRVRSLLGTDEPVMPRLASVKTPAPKTKARNNPPRPPARAKSEGPRESREVAGQARGLLLSADEDT